ncbi:LamG-like jellyroll fold domain-containing protein [Kitasatospora azatica]|uniref:LamG-like jellyroll fold domain-containing protein n=1 Tax=Kitasatospora azatica TaxID=58347 RepID=UPI001E4C7652|nr:LamG-like jellyroll fold domain-containing protein [Kitasatospora azatica]
MPATQAHAATCTTFFVSASGGSDSNDGCSSSTPWQSIAKVNATTFTAGNQILFQDGGSWTGELQPQGSGSTGNPITVSSYGSGAAPILNGGGAAATVFLKDQQNWTIQNLEITNTAGSAAVRSGVQLENDTSGILNGIHIVNNNIHNVLGFWANVQNPVQPSQSAGIAFDVTDNNATSGWNDVLVQGNTLAHDDAAAVYIGSLLGLNHNINSTNVVINNNTITDAGGNDIVCVFCASPLIENNVAFDNGYRYSGAGLWNGWTTNAVFQNNEVSRQFRNFVDGQAFDIDNNTSGTVIQYNWSHDNPFGFTEWCCSSGFAAKTSVIRYNISQNDGASNAIFPTLSGVDSNTTAQVYNNTIYMGEGDNGKLTDGTPNSNVSFSNNLIYKLGTGGYSTANTTWSHNLFYGNHPSSEPSDSAKITSNPLFVSPGTGGTGRASASVYELQSGSPALGAGTLISGNGGQDYFGNPVSSSTAPNIGAYNGSAVAGPTALQNGGYWPLDENTGTATADISGDSNNGTLQAGASWTTGKVGTSAVNLTGASNSWVDVPTTAVDTSGSYSVSAWVKPNSLTGNQTYASTDGSSISPFYLQLTGGKFAFTTRSSDSTGSTATQVLGLAPTTGTWYQLTGVYDNSAHTIALYVNGALQGSTAFSSPWKANGHTTIGRAKWNGGNVDFVNGAIDDVRMVPRALNSHEAYALGTGAAGYYQLDEGSGQAVTNLLGNTDNGYKEGNTAWAGNGKVGSNSLSFDGTTGTEAVIPSSVIDTGQSYTVAAWVKLNTVSGGNQTFASLAGFNVSPFYLQLSGGKFTFATRSSDSTSSSAAVVTATSSATTGTWFHVLGMYDSSTQTISLYVNGTLQGSTSFTSPWAARGATVIGAGTYNRGPVDLTNGQIDDVHFYNRTLTSTEISQLAAG